MMRLVGIDQGTSGTTVLTLDASLEVRSVASRQISRSQTADGGVEQDPWEVLASVVDACSEALGEDPRSDTVAAGFAHQGETVLAWEADTLRPLTPAIVWSDRRPESVTEEITRRGLDSRVASLSGMRLDHYFCAAKYRWIYQSFPDVRQVAVDGKLRMGTLDTWLLAQLGAQEGIEVGTASRTQLTRLGETDWNNELLDIFELDAAWLSPIVATGADRGLLNHRDWSFQLPLRCVMVDQPAALVGNGCLEPGAMKVTYGTGAFVLANYGEQPPSVQPELISSVGWGDADGVTYVLDGGVLSVGSALAWLGALGVDVSPEAHLRLEGRPPSSITVAPWLDGRGAPQWDRDARASIRGLHSAVTGDDLLHAFLDSFAYRVREVSEAVEARGVPRPAALRVDGGLTRSGYLMQMQADVLGLPLAIAAHREATALGVAMMAGLLHGAVTPSEATSVLERVSWTVEPRDIAVADQAFQRWITEANAI